MLLYVVMLSDLMVMMKMMMKNVMMMVLNMLMVVWVNFFFAGFVVGRTSFLLT